MQNENQEKRSPTEAILNIGMYDVDFIMTNRNYKLSNPTRAAAQILSQDGLGIISLQELGGGRGFHIEHDFSRVTSENIARVFGYLALRDYGGDINFIKPDGTEHPLQLSEGKKSKAA